MLHTAAFGLLATWIGTRTADGLIQNDTCDYDFANGKMHLVFAEKTADDPRIDLPIAKILVSVIDAHQPATRWPDDTA